MRTQAGIILYHFTRSPNVNLKVHILIQSIQLRLHPITQQYVYFWECAFEAAAALYHWWSLHCTHCSIEVLRMEEMKKLKVGRGEEGRSGELARGREDSASARHF
jgi:hypothetical protein